MGYINPETPLSRVIPSNQAAVAGQTVAFALPVGEVTYAALRLIYKKVGVRATYAQMVADILRIRLKLNGTTMQELSGKQFADLFNYKGHTIQDGEINLMFSDPTARTPVLEGITSLGTGGLKSATLEVDLAAGAGATLSLNLEAITFARNEAPGWLIRRNTFTLNAAAAGDTEFKLENGLGDVLALHFFSAAITGYRIEKDRAIIAQGDLTSLHNWLKLYGRIPQTGYVHWEPVMRDNLAERFPVSDADDFRVIITTNAAATIQLAYDTLYAPFGIPTAK